MNSRERVLTALAHQEPDRVPLCLAYETPDALAARYGQPYDPDLMRQDVAAVMPDMPPPAEGLCERYLADTPAHAHIDAWGVARWPSSTGQSYTVVGPLRAMSRPEDLDAFPWPDVGADRYAANLPQRVAEQHAMGLAVQGAMSQTIFELAWNMLGMERLLEGFYAEPAFIERLFDEITQRKAAMACQFARAGVDILRLGDDVGSQKGLLLNPRIWRRTLKPRLAAIIAAARAERSGLPVFYHSDGDVTAIVPDLIEAGVTILNPVQPECMDPFAVKRLYGDQLTLWGTLGTQTTFPFGTPADVRDTVRRHIVELGQGGGLVLGPTHSINDDVSWENLTAFYQAVADYGSYPPQEG